MIGIEGMNSESTAMTLTMSADGRDPVDGQPALVFTRYENEYRLSQVWESDTVGRELPGFSATRQDTRAEPQSGPSEAHSYVVAVNRK